MASPAPVPCAEKQRLLMEYGKAAEECIRLHTAKTDAVVRGDDFPHVEQLAAAEIARDNAKYAIIAHQQRHGC